jgi:hypothetical protein
MEEPDNMSSTLKSEMMIQYSALGNDLRFHADQRFKIAGAFLIATGLLANVAKDHGTWGLALVGIALSCLCLSWDRYTSLWWWALIDSLDEIEDKGIKDEKLIKAYKKYKNIRELAPSGIRRPLLLRASQAVEGIYYLSIVAWAWWWCQLFGVLALLAIGLVTYIKNQRLNHR